VKVGVLSDSHIPASTRRIPEQVFRAFDGVELILHGGDIYTAAALDHLQSLAPVLAVGEGVDHAIGSPRVEVKRVLELEGARIGMVHCLQLPGVLSEIFPGTIDLLRHHREAGLGTRLAPSAGDPGSQRLDVSRALYSVFDTNVDVCIFGDTHYEVLEYHDEVLLLNPGSPTLPHQMMRLGTVCVMEVNDGRVTARLVPLSELPGPPPAYI